MFIISEIFSVWWRSKSCRTNILQSKLAGADILKFNCILKMIWTRESLFIYAVFEQLKQFSLNIPLFAPLLLKIRLVFEIGMQKLLLGAQKMPEL